MNKPALALMLSFAKALERGGASVAGLCGTYRFSRSKGYRIRDRLLELTKTNTPLTTACFRNAGRPWKVPRELETALVKKIERKERALLAKWRKSLAGRRGHPKEARPHQTMAEIRKMADDLEIHCSDSTLCRILTSIPIVTAGQWHYRCRVPYPTKVWVLTGPGTSPTWKGKSKYGNF
jgi:hypothetical protein